MKQSKKSTKAKPFPKQIFLVREAEGTGDEYLLVDERAENLVPLGQTIRAGRYVFEQEIALKSEVVVTIT